MALQIKRANRLSPEVEFTVRDIERLLNLVDGKFTATGTAFPGAPASGDLFRRTDRNIEYYYDGTRWLSTTLYSHPIETQNALNPMSASAFVRTAHPFAGLYDIYVERGIVQVFETATTSANYFTCQFSSATAAAAAVNLGTALSAQNITQNSWTQLSVTINAVVASTASAISVLFSETGACSGNLLAAIQYRLVG